MIRLIRSQLRGLRWHKRRLLAPPIPPAGSEEDVLNKNARCTTRVLRSADGDEVLKAFSTGDEGQRSLDHEILADQVFGNCPWEVGLRRSGDRELIFWRLPTSDRLDFGAYRMNGATRRAVALEAARILLEIFLAGYAHRDFHARNLFWDGAQLRLIDFETLYRYPPGERPAFPDCYDITGEGLPSPFQSGWMCFDRNHATGMSLGQVLNVSSARALRALERGLVNDLRESSQTFKSDNRRHECGAGRVYCSFDLPYLSVPRGLAQRDGRRRLARFGLTDGCLRGKRLLDLGSHAGGMIYAAQRLDPDECLGLEFDAEKVEMARVIAAYNGLRRVTFEQADLEQGFPEETAAPFDVVLCLGVLGHLRDRGAFLDRLARATNGALYLEGNSNTTPEEIRQGLEGRGFTNVEFLGMCDDDCSPANNCRPMFTARRSD